MADANGNPENRAMRQVFTVIERNGKSFWVRIGAAFINKDGSETVLLDALPTNGRLQIRLKAASQAGAGQRQSNQVQTQ
ncbi:MAG TPA: hypothetical protein VLB09_09445 [Nitrospiria bacterium]|nr:hypothetical protein [Nitrospiria bacterium]